MSTNADVSIDEVNDVFARSSSDVRAASMLVVRASSEAVFGGAARARAPPWSWWPMWLPQCRPPRWHSEGLQGRYRSACRSSTVNPVSSHPMLRITDLPPPAAVKSASATRTRCQPESRPLSKQMPLSFARHLAVASRYLDARSRPIFSLRSHACSQPEVCNLVKEDSFESFRIDFPRCALYGG